MEDIESRKTTFINLNVDFFKLKQDYMKIQN